MSVIQARSGRHRPACPVGGSEGLVEYAERRRRFLCHGLLLLGSQPFVTGFRGCRSWAETVSREDTMRSFGRSRPRVAGGRRRGRDRAPAALHEHAGVPEAGQSESGPAPTLAVTSRACSKCRSAACHWRPIVAATPSTRGDRAPTPREGIPSAIAAELSVRCAVASKPVQMRSGRQGRNRAPPRSRRSVECPRGRAARRRWGERRPLREDVCCCIS